MPNETKIATNKLLSMLMSPSLGRLMDKMNRPNEVSITNGEIDVAMQAVKCKCIAEIETVPDKYHDYKKNQEHNVEIITHFFGEFLKQENNLQQLQQLEQENL